MIEVFKTNVKYRDHACLLIAEIHNIYEDYEANFDLDDCDSILRVKSATQIIHPTALIELLKNFGFDASVLPDDEPTLGENTLAKQGVFQ